MPYFISDNQLRENILTLKDSIDDFDGSHQKLIFFDAFSFYEHFCQHPTVRRLLDAIEPFIPLSLCADSMQDFIESASDQNRMEACADFFMLKARVDFVDSLQKANTPDRWARLVDICGTIRDIKEQLNYIVSNA
jgi:hypothetical protein